MKILMIGDYKPQVGGPSNVVQNLTSLMSREHEVCVVNMEELPYSRGLGHWFDGKVNIWQEKLWFLNDQTVLQGAIQKIKRALLLRNQVDLYHAHGPFDALIGLIDRTKPLVLTFHGYPTLESISKGSIKIDSMKFKIYRAIEKKTVERADAIIVMGKRQKEWLVDELGAKSEKIFLVHNGVDSFKFKPEHEINMNNKSEFQDGKQIIIFVKAFTEQSGIMNLIQSIPVIMKKHPNIMLLAIGGGPLQKKMEESVDSLGIKDNVNLIGRISNDSVPHYLNSADIFITPSVPLGKAEESFSISLIEAMSCGKAVIATNIGGPKEIIEGGENVGILVPPNDSDAIANAVIGLLDDPEKTKKMGKNAREYIKSNYTWEKTYSSTLIVYEYASKMNKFGYL